ncbi:hypothetical protein HPB52_003293 [Rhipicephalus sanguineus]|uniref:Uncharacterized protein n=1 Tax=Rhipicephalus sanguineus TaxID=34632 RepID=A0A9D4SXF0_RHISA|nr:hypothetical protein HPB52_003293 [Rhipicephalus sanguineus]
MALAARRARFLRPYRHRAVTERDDASRRVRCPGLGAKCKIRSPAHDTAPSWCYVNTTGKPKRAQAKKTPPQKLLRVRSVQARIVPRRLSGPHTESQKADQGTIHIYTGRSPSPRQPARLWRSSLWLTSNGLPSSRSSGLKSRRQNAVLVILIDIKGSFDDLPNAVIEQAFDLMGISGNLRPSYAFHQLDQKATLTNLRHFLAGRSLRVRVGQTQNSPRPAAAVLEGTPALSSALPSSIWPTVTQPVVSVHKTEDADLVLNFGWIVSGFPGARNWCYSLVVLFGCHLVFHGCPKTQPPVLRRGSSITDPSALGPADGRSLMFRLEFRSLSHTGRLRWEVIGSPQANAVQLLHRSGHPVPVFTEFPGVSMCAFRQLSPLCCTIAMSDITKCLYIALVAPENDSSTAACKAPAVRKSKMHRLPAHASWTAAEVTHLATDLLVKLTGIAVAIYYDSKADAAVFLHWLPAHVGALEKEKAYGLAESVHHTNASQHCYYGRELHTTSPASSPPGMPSRQAGGPRSHRATGLSLGLLSARQEDLCPRNHQDPTLQSLIEFLDSTPRGLRLHCKAALPDLLLPTYF